jgi:hypothetical protein
MNKRKLAAQALRYLASLKQPLPPESDTAFYKQNSADYQALAMLNNKKLGATTEALEALVNAPLSASECKRIVKRLQKLDALYSLEIKKEEAIDNNPKYWDGFFSGLEASPTNRCKQLKRGIENRIEQITNEQNKLYQQITKQQALDAGYWFACDMESDDFKLGHGE